MKQEIAAVPASRFGLHLNDEAHPAARGYVRDDLTREKVRFACLNSRADGILRPRHMTASSAGGTGAELNRSSSPDPPVPQNCLGARILRSDADAGRGFTARPRMDRRELIGRWVLGPNGMTWVDGPAALAWRNGWVLLINEFSAAPPEVWVSANDLLKGFPSKLIRRAR